MAMTMVMVAEVLVAFNAACVCRRPVRARSFRVCWGAIRTALMGVVMLEFREYFPPALACFQYRETGLIRVRKTVRQTVITRPELAET